MLLSRLSLTYAQHERLYSYYAPKWAFGTLNTRSKIVFLTCAHSSLNLYNIINRRTAGAFDYMIMGNVMYVYTPVQSISLLAYPEKGLLSAGLVKRYRVAILPKRTSQQ
jgi:hypothetical protein